MDRESSEICKKRKIKFFDSFELNKRYLKDYGDSVADLVKNKSLILGEAVSEFEKNFAKYTGAKYCVGVGNGYDALYLALKANGIGIGDEVIVPSNTYIATWLAVSAVGAKPVPVEPKLSTYNIDLSNIHKFKTDATKAILVVHLYGRPAEITDIYKYARENSVLVIEDAAQAHGAASQGSKIGGGDGTVAWSFYPTKNLGALGDAGAVTTSSLSIYEKLKSFRNYGSTERYINEIKGVNSRLDAVQAIFLTAKLKHLNQLNTERSKQAEIYNHEITSTFVTKPAAPFEFENHVWHLYTLLVQRREELISYLSENGVETLIHYPIPPHLQIAYKDLGYKKGDFPISEYIANNTLSLPLGPHLHEHDVVYVSQLINQFYD